MLHTLRFSLQNAVYFIMLLFWFLYYSHFYIQDVLKFKCKFGCQKVNACRKKNSFEKKTWTGMETHILYSRNLCLRILKPSRQSNESDLTEHNYTGCLYFLACLYGRQSELSFPITDSRGALCYKPECRGFGSRLCHYNF